MWRSVCLLCLVGLLLGDALGPGGSLASSARAADAPAVAAPPAAERLPAGLSVVSLRVEPEGLRLTGSNRRQQLLVSGVCDDGREVDLTRLARFELAPAADLPAADLPAAENEPLVARLDGTRLIGVRDGRATLRVAWGELAWQGPVVLDGVETPPPVDFARDVNPILTRLGCNSGGCHGRASGQNGFKLSVFGFDHAFDYEAIVHQARGRRVNPSDPAASLILTKPAGVVPHGGGQRLKVDSLDYEVLRHWIDQGLPPADPQVPQLVALHVRPAERVLWAGASQQILATAHYSDGTVRDVTHAAFYASNAPHVAEVDPQGLIRVGQNPGEAALTVNYMGQVAAVQVQSPRGGSPATADDPPANNTIDQLVWTKLRKMGLSASGLCDDATFLRRVSLDLLGTLPTVDEAESFLHDPNPRKRERWIDELLTREAFADFWSLKWADILLVDREKLGDRGAFEFHRWLRGQFARNRPYDAWVRELLTATGDSAKFGPVNFFRSADTPDALARTVSQAFLGVRVECAQCHHHPFEKWSQEDYYSLAAFFHGLELRPLGKDRVLVLHPGYRDLTIPQTTTVVTAHALDAPVSERLKTGDPRQVLAEWLTAPDNRWFARLAVNRLWKHFVGRGLVEAEDDLRSTNPPTNAPLLDHLANELVRSGFDLKHVMREILSSRVYQLSSEPNANNQDDEQNFSHHVIRRQSAEVLLDAISQVTGVPESFPGRPVGTRAIALWNNRLPSYFLEIFGRPERNTPCECGRSSDPTMAQALHLMNAPEVEAKIAHPQGRVARLVESGKSPAEIVEELTLAALGRFPDERQKMVARRLFDAAPPREAAEDYLWTLLNSYDFVLIK